MTEIHHWSRCDSTALIDAIASLEDGYDTVVSGCDSAAGLFETQLRNPENGAVWLVTAGEDGDRQVVGLFSLESDSLGTGALETTTYLVPAARGIGVNSDLKKAAQAASYMLGRRLVSIVRDWNELSRRAMRNEFPDVAGAFQPLESGEGVWVYLLTASKPPYVTMRQSRLAVQMAKELIG